MQEKKLLNISEAARYLGMSVSFLRKATRQRTIPFFRLGGKSLRFSPEALDLWLASSSSGADVPSDKNKSR